MELEGPLADLKVGPRVSLETDGPLVFLEVLGPLVDFKVEGALVEVAEAPTTKRAKRRDLMEIILISCLLKSIFMKLCKERDEGSAIFSRFWRCIGTRAIFLLGIFLDGRVMNI
jgi:hypothetical protein